MSGLCTVSRQTELIIDQLEELQLLRSRKDQAEPFNGKPARRLRDLAQDLYPMPPTAGTRVTTLDLTDEEEAALIRLLQQTVEDARFAYVLSLAPLKTILEKLVSSKPRPPPPLLPAGGAPSRARRRRR